MKYLIIAGLLILMSCGESGSNCEIEFNSPFIVEKGRTYCHPEGGEIRITEIGNSYCPCNVDCIWAGEAYVEGIWILDQVETSFRIHQEMEDSNTEGFSIHSVQTDEACEPVITEIQITVIPS